MINDSLFVYEKKNTSEIQVVYFHEAPVFDADKNWKHIGRLHPMAYIKSLLIEYPALVRKMKGE